MLTYIYIYICIWVYVKLLSKSSLLKLFTVIFCSKSVHIFIETVIYILYTYVFMVTVFMQLQLDPEDRNSHYFFNFNVR